jgi:branched-chain amino acid transport system ATP-binding protein
MTVLAIRDLYKSFGGVQAVAGISFEIGRGELMALIGPNGAGKSTCFNMIGGQLRPDAGDILFEGRSIAGLQPRQIWRLGSGRTFQIAATFASMTVIENVQLALASHDGRLHDMVGSLGARRRREAEELLNQVGMTDAAHRACRELAYGDVKRVELAIALANDPRLLLMDEPTAGMGPRERLDMMALVKRLVAGRGVTVLFTEHSMDVVFAFADRIVVMARGALIAEGDAAAIRNNAQVQEVYLGAGETYAKAGAPSLPSQTSVSSSAKERVKELPGDWPQPAPSPRLPLGRLRPSEPAIGPAEGGTRWTGYGEGWGEGGVPQGSDSRRGAPHPDPLPPLGGEGETRDADTVLEVDNLNAWYGAARVLFGLTLRVGRGEAVALMGRNGAGKSTTIKSVMALMARRSGTVRFCGRDISRLRPYEIARLGIGFVPEDRRVFSDLTVAENLDVGRQPPRRLPDGKPAPLWTEARLYELFPNLAAMANRLGRQMSGGEQQMLAVARTLMGNPLLVLLDEPSEGVAPVIVERMANTIAELKKAGLSVLLSEQNIHFAEQVCDRAYVLEKGQVQWQGAMMELAGDTVTQRALLSM